VLQLRCDINHSLQSSGEVTSVYGVTYNPRIRVGQLDNDNFRNFLLFSALRNDKSPIDNTLP
jgi:hypothetical protein